MALNQMQQQAVQHTEGPLLILAGDQGNRKQGEGI